MNLIQEELKNAESKMLSTIPETDLVALSQENVAIVEAMIQNDSAYLKSSDKEAAPNDKYRGSTAFWMMRLKEVLINRIPANEEEYHDILAGTIEAVDRENSTHLNADGIGREEILKRLIQIDQAKLVEYLKDPDGTNLWLINYIAAPTHPTGYSQRGTPYRARTNVSFASKFCHYACFYLFEGEEEQDNYSIYDYVLKKVLPRYIAYYGLRDWNLDDYADYRKAVNDIIAAANARISRNGFDHLLWYYFKGRI